MWALQVWCLHGRSIRHQSIAEAMHMIYSLGTGPPLCAKSSSVARRRYHQAATRTHARTHARTTCTHVPVSFMTSGSPEAYLQRAARAATAHTAALIMAVSLIVKSCTLPDRCAQPERAQKGARTRMYHLTHATHANSCNATHSTSGTRARSHRRHAEEP